MEIDIYIIYPSRKTSANFRNAALIRMGKGCFSKRAGNRTIDSHCSPTFPDLRPINQLLLCTKYFQARICYKIKYEIYIAIGY